jgi:hypothetical protein
VLVSAPCPAAFNDDGTPVETPVEGAETAACYQVFTFTGEDDVAVLAALEAALDAHMAERHS